MKFQVQKRIKRLSFFKSIERKWKKAHKHSLFNLMFFCQPRILSNIKILCLHRLWISDLCVSINFEKTNDAMTWGPINWKGRRKIEAKHWICNILFRVASLQQLIDEQTHKYWDCFFFFFQFCFLWLLDRTMMTKHPMFV